MDADEENRGEGRMKPASVVINPPSQTEEKFAVETQPTPNAAQGLHQAFPIQSERDRRIKIASIVVLVSMFFHWGYQYWLEWTIFWNPNDTGNIYDPSYYYNLWDYLMYSEFSFEGGIGFVEMLNFFFRFQIWGDVAELVGPLFVLFMMRELMPFVFVGTLVFCWINREKDDMFFRKVTLFYGGYFLIMAIQLIYIKMEFSRYDHWEFNLFFDCFGFWLAGFAGLILDPKVIKLPERVFAGKETFIPDLNQPGENPIWQQNSISSEDGTNFGVFALFYLPLLYHLMTVISVMGGGDDDALFLGITIPIVGLLVGIGMYRLEFLKGFGIHLACSVGYGLLSYLLTIIGLLLPLEEGAFILFLIVAAILPIRYHLQKKHVQALGATYAIPLTFWFMLFGLVIGWFQVDW